MSTTPSNSDAGPARPALPAVEPWRRLALYLLLVGTAGVAVELVLMEHYEDVWQWTPIALLGGGLVLGALIVFRPRRIAVRMFRGLMAVYVFSAGLGIYFHLKANVEFELELRPTMGGSELIIETLKGAMPALAPGAMLQLGLLGLLIGFRHPAFAAVEPDMKTPNTVENR